MSTAYDDIGVVSQLLEEKEKDLELAAKIGQSLLERNKDLQYRNEFLEEQVGRANDQLTQLKHDLRQKISLLHIYASETGDSDASSVGDAADGADADNLNRKLRALETENAALKLEASHLKQLTQGLEEKEEHLVRDCVKQLEEAQLQLSLLRTELSEKSEECSTHRQEVTRLLKDVLERQHKEKRMMVVNEELAAQLVAAQETQGELTQEVLELQERYAEVIAILHEAQTELRTHRNLHPPLRCGSPLADSLYDSLGSELEASDSGCFTTPRFSTRLARDDLEPHNDSIENVKRVLQVIEPDIPDWRDANRLCRTPPLIHTKESTPTKTTSPTLKESTGKESPCPTIGTPPSACSPGSDRNLSPPGGGPLAHCPSTDSLAGYPGPSMGEPGCPGTRDLEYAIRRLSLRRKVERDYQNFRKERGLTPVSTPLIIPSAPTGTAVNASGAITSSSVGPTGASLRGGLLAKTRRPPEGSRILDRWRLLAIPSLFGAAARTVPTSGVQLRPAEIAKYFSRGQTHFQSPRSRADSGLSVDDGDLPGPSSRSDADSSSYVPNHQRSSTPTVNSFVTSSTAHSLVASASPILSSYATNVNQNLATSSTVDALSSSHNTKKSQPSAQTSVVWSGGQVMQLRAGPAKSTRANKRLTGGPPGLELGLGSVRENDGPEPDPATPDGVLTRTAVLLSPPPAPRHSPRRKSSDSGESVD